MSIDGFLKSVVDMANENMALMDRTTAPVKELFDAGDIVVGVWQDPQEQYGVGYLVLKGDGLLRECIASGKKITARITAIPCVSHEQALAAKREFGGRLFDA